MSPLFILSYIAAYFGFLFGIAWYTGRKADNASYFLGNKQSPWYAVAFGLIGESLSGVTFISVPGAVRDNQFSYLQVVLGYVLGYLTIALVLLPLYYRLNLTSIYSYLLGRFGTVTQKTGSVIFVFSRTFGAAARLYLTMEVLQHFVFNSLGIPFWIPVATIIGLIFVYTYKGGIKTLVWTDTFQSGFLLLGVILSIAAILHQLHLGFGGLISTVAHSPHNQIFFWDWLPGNNFWKQFFGGAFITIAMTGLDQNMMQKNLSCRSLKDAQKNIYWFSITVVLVNFMFLCLGALLYAYAQEAGVEVPAKSDLLFPLLALQKLGAFAAVVFVLGLTAATFCSADSVLTTLTTSFCIDILGMDGKAHWSEEKKTSMRHRTHIAFAIILLLAILAFRLVNSKAVIDAVLKIATYTYGPLIGLFGFGLICRWRVKDAGVPVACVLAPLICYVLDTHSKEWFGGYKFGNELLILNGALTALGLLLLSSPKAPPVPDSQAQVT